MEIDTNANPPESEAEHSHTDIVTGSDTQDFISGIPDFNTAEKSDKDLKDYPDPYTTKEQKARDEMITSLLKEYVKSYQNKVEQSKKYREKILKLCITIILIFAISFSITGIYILISSNVLRIPHLIAFITSCISFVSLIIGVLKIATKYFFPENDEQYITQIVEAIQSNDLKNKQENAKNNINPTNDETNDIIEAKLKEILDGLKEL